jgi:hypothetical protein
MILRDARVYVGGYDLSGDHNEVQVTVGFREADGTRFGHRAECVAATIATVEATGKGFVRIGPTGTNRALRQNLGVENVPITILSGDPVLEDAAIETFIAEVMTYRAGAAAGDLLSFDWTAKAQGHPSESGTLLASGTITATSVGAARAMTIGVGASVVMTLHVLTVSGVGPLLDVLVESDTTAAFTSPKLRGTFPTMNAPGSATIVLPAAPADGYWRARWTVGGTNPGFSVAVVTGTES